MVPAGDYLSFFSTCPQSVVSPHAIFFHFSSYGCPCFLPLFFPTFVLPFALFARHLAKWVFCWTGFPFNWPYVMKPVAMKPFFTLSFSTWLVSNLSLVRRLCSHRPCGFRLFFFSFFIRFSCANVGPSPSTLIFFYPNFASFICFPTLLTFVIGCFFQFVSIWPCLVRLFTCPCLSFTSFPAPPHAFRLFRWGSLFELRS